MSDQESPFRFPVRTKNLDLSDSLQEESVTVVQSRPWALCAGLYFFLIIRFDAFKLRFQNDKTVTYEFGDSVYEFLRDLPTSDLQTSNSSSLSSPITPQPLHEPTSILVNRMIQKEFFDYMLNFTRSLGTIWEKKLASVIDGST